MQRGFVRTIAFVLVASLLLSGTALAGGAALPAGITRKVLSDSQATQMLEQMQAWIDAGLPVNGVKNARLLSPSGTTPRDFTITSISLSAMPGILTTYVPPSGEGNPFSASFPVLLTSKPLNMLIDPDMLTVQSSNPSVAKIETHAFGPFTAYPFLVAVGNGTTTLSVQMDNGMKASKKVTVTNKMVRITSFTIHPFADPVTATSMTLTQGVPGIFIIVSEPFTATFGSLDSTGFLYAGRYSSSNDSVASVLAPTFPGAGSPMDLFERAPVVYPKAPGKATITIRSLDGGNAKATLKVTVKGIPVTSLNIPEDSYGLQIGATRKLKCEIEPFNAYDQSLVWSSSNKYVATVDAKGNVTGLKAGDATITCKNKASNLTDSTMFHVSYDKVVTGTKYHFYGFANTYDEDDPATGITDLPACENDLLMTANAYGIYATDASSLTQLTAAQLAEKLGGIVSSPTAPIDEDDVTVVYYSGHGTVSFDQTERGAWVGTDGNLVTIDEIQAILDQVPGTVVVILDSCLSGQAITSKSLSPSARSAQAAAFNRTWVSSLSNSKATNYTRKALTGSTVKSKYKVLTACGSLEPSWSLQNFGWFTYWLDAGLGMLPDDTTGAYAISAPRTLPADANADHVVTLTEAYNYVKAGVATDATPNYHQDVQAWPAGDKTAIFSILP